MAGRMIRAVTPQRPRQLSAIFDVWCGACAAAIHIGEPSRWYRLQVISMLHGVIHRSVGQTCACFWSAFQASKRPFLTADHVLCSGVMLISGPARWGNGGGIPPPGKVSIQKAEGCSVGLGTSFAQSNFRLCLNGQGTKSEPHRDTSEVERWIKTGR